MESKTKIVTAPLSITEMDSDLESKTVYIFDYEKSELKGIEFLEYIKNCGLLADVYFSENVSSNDKIELLLHYMKSNTFYHLTSFNASILNTIYFIYGKREYLNKYGFLNYSEMNDISLKNNNLFKQWKSMYDEVFYYMMNMIHLGKENMTDIKKIKELYDDGLTEFNDTNELSPNIFSLLLDPFFYDYYDILKAEIISDGVYYTYYFDNYIYDEKSLPLLLLNDSNYVIKILYNTMYNPKFKEFLESKTDLILN